MILISDTESADVRPRPHRSFPPIKLTSFFRKNRDKVASSEEAEPQKVDDEVKEPLEGAPDGEEEPKEGLVYAELDLVSPQSVTPVVKNDEKTEYAEIVYTPSDDNKKA
ncbi:hypothetical protein BDFB_010388 [Asbolus verrucosus]|uniref:Uncharacterized protein n=1 Tax=Asbolus verrucosus TaxID=1661398 RepID=A0A482VBE2_ASBVE|nr:hypothetical protein BDFB_010388 [Asbolus verrucosus]